MFCYQTAFLYKKTVYPSITCIDVSNAIISLIIDTIICRENGFYRNDIADDHIHCHIIPKTISRRLFTSRNQMKLMRVLLI